MSSTNELFINLHLQTDNKANRLLATLLQRGFLVPVAGEITLAELLIPLPGFSEQYIQDRVQTIFVNGISEDNLDRKLFPGDTLALSAAMPGLAGAIFRRGGQHASLRTRPSSTPNTQEHNQRTSGYITLKLFNMIAMETGGQLLEKGIMLRGKTLISFLNARGKKLEPQIRTLEINTIQINYTMLLKHIRSTDVISLKIQG